MGALKRARAQAQLRELPVAPLVRGAVLAPELQKDLDGLLGHLGRLVEAQAELGELAGPDALADAEVEPPAREIVERGRLGGEAQRVVEGQDVDVVAEAHARGALERGRDHQVWTREQRVVGEVMLGEPAFAEAERFGQRDLVQHLAVGLIVGHAAALAVIEEPEVHGQGLSPERPALVRLTCSDRHLMIAARWSSLRVSSTPSPCRSPRT